MTVTHTNYRTYTFHELKSPTTESYNMIRYEHLPDHVVFGVSIYTTHHEHLPDQILLLLVGSHVVLIALRRYQKFQCRINLFQLQQKLPNVQI